MLYQTPIGPHDGDTWERLCHVCLTIKFNKSQYIDVPASPGDYGIDGFNSIGEAFQCYCPERECSDKDLYASQRKKITDDINKLKKHKGKIDQLLNGSKITSWYLLTPKITSNDLIFHCNTKADLVKSWNLPFVGSDFKVIPLDYKYIAAELPIALSMLEYTTKPGDTVQKIDLKASTVNSEEVEKYKTDLQNSEYTKKAYRKHEIRYELLGNADPNRVLTQVDRTVKSLLIGDSILKEWETRYQDQFERFNSLIDTLERNVSDLCDIPTNDPEGRYKEIQKLVQEYIDKEFHFLTQTTRMNLAMRVISDWLLRCPLNFE